MHLIANKICTVCKLTTFYCCIEDVLPVYKKKEEKELIPGEHLLLKGLFLTFQLYNIHQSKKWTSSELCQRCQLLSILLQTVLHAKLFMVDSSNWEDWDNRKEEVINNLWGTVSVLNKNEIQTGKVYLKPGATKADRKTLSNTFSSKGRCKIHV